MKKSSVLSVVCVVLMGWFANTAVAQAANGQVGDIAESNEAGKVAASGIDRQVQVEDTLVSIFENATVTIQYGYIENLNDGRGFTAGRSGFTSGTGDLLQVVQEYTAHKPGNALAQYIPALRAVNGSASTMGLGGFPEAWVASASDPEMIAAQNAVNTALHRVPARKLASNLGTLLPISLAALYEAGIQHGFGDDADSVKSIAQRASEQVGGSPASGVDEKTWLRAFLEKRREDLLAPANSATAKEWQNSVDRANAMIALYNAENYDLSQRIVISVFGRSYSF